jgi:UDP:flavonoid glycosyltransferase YjiC (YdhE family)
VDTSGQKHVDAVELRNKINHVLTNPTFAQNAQHISKKLKTYGGASAAAQLIEDFSKGESQ